MRIDEVAKVLAKIKLGDNRSVEESVIREWADTIGHLRFEDAIAAVTLHRQESAEYLVPAHIIANARRVRAARPEVRAVESFPPGDPKPTNFEAMIEAAGDPVRFGMEVAKYRAQLRGEQ
jgi:hypothetical protein